MDAITMLKDDHATVEKLFKKFEKAGDRAFVTKRKLVDQMIEELSIHAAIEEQAFYPAARSTIATIEDQIDEGIEEHLIVKRLLAELESMEVEDDQFDAKVTVLIENVRHHVEEEEDDLFSKVREEWGRNDLAELADIMTDLKDQVSPHPHPEEPSRPPANIVIAKGTAVVDRVSDLVSGIGQGSVNAVQDLVDRVRGITPRRSSPTGSSTARDTAANVRGSAGEAVDALVDKVTSARDAGKHAVDTADDTARDMTKTARDGAKKAVDPGRKRS